MPNWILETERLRLRLYTPADEADLFQVFSDADARAFYPQMSDRANVRKWIAWNLRHYDEFGYGLWAMELRTLAEIKLPLWPPRHPAGLRCSSLAYAQYARSSRLAGRAPRRPQLTALFPPGP